MDLNEKIVVIMNGTNDFAAALASRLKEENATVVLSDRHETRLVEKAKQTGAVPIVSELDTRQQFERFIDQVLVRFERIDLFVFQFSFHTGGHPHTPNPGTNKYWHNKLILFMHTINYLLPRMIKNNGGHLVLPVPVAGLMATFTLPDFSLLRHEALFIAEKLAAKCRNLGIGVSALCTERMAIQEGRIAYWSHVRHCIALSETFVKSIREQRFLICSQKEIHSIYNRNMLQASPGESYEMLHNRKSAV